MGCTDVCMPFDFTMNKLITQKGRDALAASCDGTDGPKRPFVPAA